MAARPVASPAPRSATNSPPRSRSPRKEHAHQEHRGHEARFAEARDKAAVTEHKSSSVVHQNQFLARAVALVGYQSLEPSKTIETATEQSASIMMALAGTGLRHSVCSSLASIAARKITGRPQSTSQRLSSAQQPISSRPAVPRREDSQALAA